MDYNTLSRKKVGNRSRMSDEDLARMIDEESKRNPSEYSSESIISVDSIPTSSYFVGKTSAHAIDQIKNWL